MNGDDYDDYAGHGIDHEESAQDVMGVDLGNGLKSKIRNSEDNPSKPLDKGQAGDEGGLLNAGEKDQQSDKDTNSEEGASWANRTGTKAAMMAAAGGGAGAAAKFTRGINGRGKGKGKGAAKVAGPIGTILIMLAMGIGGALGGQSTMLASLVGNLQGSFDPIDIAAATRSKVLLKSIMSGKNAKGGLWSKFSDHMKARFSESGIAVDSDGDTESLRYKNSNDEDVKVDADNFDAEIKNNTEFNAKYQEGASTYNNGVAEYFDSDSQNVMKYLGVSRNTLKDIDTENVEGDDESTRYQEMEKRFNEDTQEKLENSKKRMSAEIQTGDEEREQVYDESGDPIEGETRPTGEVDSTGRTDIDVNADTDEAVTEAVEKMAKESVDGKLDFSLVGQVANGACQVYNTATSINRMVKAYEAAQVVVMAMRILEAVQRMQAGDGGGDTLLNIVGNYLTREKTTTFDFGEDGTETVKGSVLSSAPIAAVFGGAKLTSEDPIVKSFITSQNQFRKIMSKMDSAAGYKICVGMQLAAGIADAVADGFTLGGAKLLSLLVSVSISAAISMAIGSIVSIMVPKIVNALKRDFTSFLEGPEASGVLMWGSEQIMGENAKHTAMQPANPQTLTAYVKMKQEVIADRARHDRYALSPFDTSSQYTFMGTLTRSLTTATLKTNSIVGNVGNVMSVVGKSLISLTPATYAAGTVEEIISEGDCPEINNINEDNKYASAFCTPHYISDYSTMGEGPEDVMNYWANKGAFDNYDPVENPNPAIRTDNDNELALCVEEYPGRGAEIGYPDAAIEEKYASASTGSGFWDAVLGAIPIIGGLIDAFNNEQKLAHLKNILGSKYTEDTVQNHMCERYILDQRMGESMGIYDKSQTAVFMENYLKEHPLDNSTLGIVARRSGMTKDQVEKNIAMLNGLAFVAEYDPDGLGPLFFEEKEVKLTIESTENYGSIVVGIIYHTAAIGEKRNQNVTA